MARRPRQIPARELLSVAKIDAASYVGSGEHKQSRWWGGLPGAYVGEDGVARRPKKQLTTICHFTEEADRQRATKWVREAITAGQVRFYEGDKDFPKHIWYKDANGRLWFGCCVNGVQGQYKGWPIDEEERVAIFG
jgi:hypothetical protein